MKTATKDAVGRAIDAFDRTLATVVLGKGKSEAEQLEILKSLHPVTGELERFEGELRGHDCGGEVELCEEFCTIRARCCACGQVFEMNLQDFKADVLHLPEPSKSEVEGAYRRPADRLAHFRAIVGTSNGD